MESGGSSSVQTANIPSQFAHAETTGGSKRPQAEMADAHHTHHPLLTHPSEPPLSAFVPPRRQRLALPPLDPSIRSPISMVPPPLAEPRRGYDHRRPVSTINNLPPVADVVDLTAEDDSVDEEEDHGRESFMADTRVHAFNRPSQQPHRPRFSGGIIDLSGDSSPPRTEHASTRYGSPRGGARRTPYRENRITPSLRHESSSDVAFLNQRRRLDPRRTEPPTPSPPRRRQAHHTEIDLTVTSDPDDVIFLSSRQNPDPQSPVRPAGRQIHRIPDDEFDPFLESFGSDESGVHAELGSSGTTMAAGMSRLAQSLHNVLGQPGFAAVEYARRMAMPAARVWTMAGNGSRTTFVAPANMNYSMSSFDLGIIDDEPPRQPSYQAPPAPDEGFTRTPCKTEEVVCPACGDELAHGTTELKMQVWVVKACGHVYCGQCMANRSKSRAKANGKARAVDALAWPSRHFSECVVDGCKSNVRTKTSVCQIFL